MPRSIALALLILAAIWLEAGGQETVSLSRTIVVDRVGNNILYRTNTPINNGVFDYDQLISAMKQKATDLKIPFPDKYKLVSYSLFNFLNKDLKVEKEYFKKNPQVGRLTVYPIVGSITYANKYSEAFRQILANTYKLWNYDKLDVIATTMHEDLQKQEELPKLIFFHCQAGEDRTGEVFGGYQMFINRWTYKMALDFDNQVETRVIKKASRNGMNWFCWYLHYTKSYENLKCDYEYPSDY